MFRSHHEIFIRRSWYSVLPSLDATIKEAIHIRKEGHQATNRDEGTGQLSVESHLRPHSVDAIADHHIKTRKN